MGLIFVYCPRFHVGIPPSVVTRSQPRDLRELGSKIEHVPRVDYQRYIGRNMLVAPAQELPIPISIVGNMKNGRSFFPNLLAGKTLYVAVHEERLGQASGRCLRDYRRLYRRAHLHS